MTSALRAEALAGKILRMCVEMGGSITGEHGVGLGKARFLVAEHGEAAVDVMRLIKTVLDPEDILNPGKILPDVTGG